LLEKLRRLEEQDMVVTAAAQGAIAATLRLATPVCSSRIIAKTEPAIIGTSCVTAGAGALDDRILAIGSPLGGSGGMGRANVPKGSTAVDFTVECEWVRRCIADVPQRFGVPEV
jgi:hypothetical protein